MGILEEYDQAASLYRAFAEKCASLIGELLVADAINVHSISSRLKTRDSLETKINTKPGGYNSLDDVTDIAGARVVTYYEDTVSKVAQLIEREFTIDGENSSDKKDVLDPDRFGYLSLHFVAGLSEARLSLAEYRAFRSCKCELQIRSILQHAWAEIEHDLGYKTRTQVPRTIRRRFSRMAGLLELADQEFIGIRQELQEYAQSVKEEISAQPSKVEINSESLNEYIVQSKVLAELDAQLATVAGGSPLRGFAPSYTASYSELCAALEITSIAELDRLITSNTKVIIEFARKFLDRKFEVSQGIGIFYLGYVCIGRSKDVTKVVSYLNRLRISTADERPGLAERILSTLGSLEREQH